MHKSWFGRLRKFTDLPIAVGFGISTAEQFAAVGEFADAAVVGSAIVETIERNPGKEAESVAEFIRQLSAVSSQPSVKIYHWRMTTDSRSCVPDFTEASTR